jgi:flagellar basal body rod protein FlgG
MFTEDGDFALDKNGDLALAKENELIEQNVRIPLRTVNPDWVSDAIGADMEDLLGLENTRETASLGKTKIKNALMKTGFFNEGDIWLEAKPTSTSAITFFVFINSPFSSNPLVYEADVDLGFGATIRKVY